jgi:site-specific recombinase XerC
MGHSHFDDASHARAAWNAGKKVGTKRPLTQKQIWAVRFVLDRERRVRDRALFDLAIDSKLRGCDLVKIRIRDLVTGPEIKTRAIVVQQKTGRPVPVRDNLRRENQPSGLARKARGHGR